jgi:predicted nucleic acid-binding protein
MVTDALEYALAYKIESWDGYIVSLAKNHGAEIIYSMGF